MNETLTSDPLLDAIASLPVVQQHARRTEAVRAQCRAALECGHTGCGGDEERLLTYRDKRSASRASCRA